MAIISKETFEKFTEEEKNKIREDYSNFTYLSENGINEEERIVNSFLESTMREYFGKENLQLEPKIKTWEDVKKAYPNTYGNENIELFPYNEFAWDVKLIRKNIATLKIAKLIELGYGGMVSKKECEENGAWQIIPYREAYNEKFKLKICYDFSTKSFISFHDEEQAEEFMSQQENIELIEQYYMI